MAGSLRWYIYVDDAENEWGVLLDETFASLAEFGFTAVTTADDIEQLPRGVKMRWINATKMTGGGGAGFVQSQFPVATMAATAWTDKQFNFTLSGSQYSKTSTRGEQKRLVTAANTGQTGTSP